MVPNDYTPDFGDNIVLDSVILTVPYYSRGVATDENGDMPRNGFGLWKFTNKNIYL